MFDINKLPNANNIISNAPTQPVASPVIDAVTAVQPIAPHAPIATPTPIAQPAIDAVQNVNISPALNIDPMTTVQRMSAEQTAQPVNNATAVDSVATVQPVKIEDVPPISDEELLNMGRAENSINSDIYTETLLNTKGCNGFTKLPDSIEDAQKLAKFLSKSSLVSPEIRSTEIADHSADVFLVIALGASLGMTPAQALTNITVTKGRPTMYVSAKAGLCSKYGTFDTVLNVNEKGVLVATATGTRNGRTMSVQYTSEDAMLAGLMKFDTNSNSWIGCRMAWIGSYPTMLKKRALGRLLDALFPDVVGGFVDKESSEEADNNEIKNNEEITKNVTKRTIKRERKNKNDDIINESAQESAQKNPNTENSETLF